MRRVRLLCTSYLAIVKDLCPMVREELLNLHHSGIGPVKMLAQLRHQLPGAEAIKKGGETSSESTTLICDPRPSEKPDYGEHDAKQHMYGENRFTSTSQRPLKSADERRQEIGKSTAKRKSVSVSRAAWRNASTRRKIRLVNSTLAVRSSQSCVRNVPFDVASCC